MLRVKLSIKSRLWQGNDNELRISSEFLFLNDVKSNHVREGFVFAGEEGGGRPIPPPFPNPTRGRCGKGAGRLMVVTAFQG